MTSGLPNDRLSKLFTCLDDYFGPENRDGRHLYRDFDLLCGNGKGHSHFVSNCEALSNGILDVLLGLSLGLSLANATGDGWTFRNVDAVFVARNGYRKDHGISVLNAKICVDHTTTANYGHG